MHLKTPHPRRPRLTPAQADVRRAVRATLAACVPGAAERAVAASEEQDAARPLVLVALSGGPDSLALAAATAFEAPRAGCRAGAVIVDHGLQSGSAAVAERAREQAEGLGLSPSVVRRVTVPDGPAAQTGGTEAAARDVRYAELDRVAADRGAALVLLAHTQNDQAETVLLGLARGSGSASVAGMPTVWRRGEVAFARPLIGIPRRVTVQMCADEGLKPWHDPQNRDDGFARVRVRRSVLPVLTDELGEHVVASLARTAELLTEDREALDAWARDAETTLTSSTPGAVTVDAQGIEGLPAAVRHRILRRAAMRAAGSSLSRDQTLTVARLVTDWHGQGPLDMPGCTVRRHGGRIVFESR